MRTELKRCTLIDEASGTNVDMLKSPSYSYVSASGVRRFRILVDGGSDPRVPGHYRLGEAFPNPFNGSTTITYDLPFESLIELKLYDVLGKQIATVESGSRAAGVYSTRISSSLLNGVSSGIYFCKLSATPIHSESRVFQQTKKLVMIK